MTGSEMSPIATTEAPTTPVAAAKRVPTKTTASATPPRSGPHNLPMVVSRSSASLPFSSRVPIKMKKGMARSTLFDITPKIRSGMAKSRPQSK